VIRRITGRSVGTFLREEFTEPLAQQEGVIPAPQAIERVSAPARDSQQRIPSRVT
jgi:CubicO group peptidase (beta-lactamase class C family)